MMINRFRKMENKDEMYIDNKKITSEHSVKLLGTEIDNQLKFDNHVSTLCKKGNLSPVEYSTKIFNILKKKGKFAPLTNKQAKIFLQNQIK